MRGLRVELMVCSESDALATPLGVVLVFPLGDEMVDSISTVTEDAGVFGGWVLGDVVGIS